MPTLHGIVSGIRVGPTGDTFVSEPGQIPAIALSDTLNGAALDLDADPFLRPAQRSSSGHIPLASIIAGCAPQYAMTLSMWARQGPRKRAMLRQRRMQCTRPCLRGTHDQHVRPYSLALMQGFYRAVSSERRASTANSTAKTTTSAAT
jgi:hypothetical protein